MIRALKPAIHIRLLGRLRIEKENIPLEGFRTQKTLALLAYLIRKNKPVARSYLAHLFWPNKLEARARRNLSVELSQLSNNLPGAFQRDRNIVHFQATEAYWVDTLAFETLVDSTHIPPSGPVPAEYLEKLTQAIALYRADFMAGFYLNDCPEFEMWLLEEQQAWRQRATSLLDCLAVYHAQQQQANQAQLYLRRWLELEPWQEEAHQYLMRLLAFGGQRSAALTQYKTCRRVLADELGVEPNAETVALYEQIRDGDLGQTFPLQGQDSEAEVELPLPPSPYRGLFAFQEKDAPYFFGREKITDRLAEVVPRRSLTAIIGPSGTGKSSLLFAGLVPRLRRKNDWLIVDFRPGAEPLQALAAALVPWLEPDMSEIDHLIEARKLAKALCWEELTLADVSAHILTKQPETQHLLLIIDQFEELYTLCPQPEIRPPFLDVFLAATRAVIEPESPLNTRPVPQLHLLLTLRADFVGQALVYRPFADALQDADIKLGPMIREELARAIEQPALMQGVTFETGLIDRILDDVGRQPGNLPLLEFTLTTLWEHQAQRQLTHVSYEAIGRVSGSLTGYADQIYTQLSETEQDQVRRTFTQLVHPGEGTEDTRRLATRTELNEDGWAMAQRLADVRLVVTGQDASGQEIVEVVHEALIRGWPQLQRWLDEDRIFRTWQERLRAALHQWEASEQDEGALLRGAPLAEAEEWYQTQADKLSVPESQFIEVSLNLRDQRLLAAEEQRQRELAQAQALVEAERQRAEGQARSTRRLRWLAIILAVVFLLAILAAFFAVGQRQEAERQAVTAEAGQLLAEMAQTEAVSAQATAEAEAVVGATVQAEAQAEAKARATAQIQAEARGQEAQIARVEAETERDRAEQQAQVALSRQLAAQALTRLDREYDLAMLLSMQANQVADTIEARNSLLIGLNRHPQIISFLHGHNDAVFRVAFSPDGKTLATASWDGTVKIWDVTTHQPLVELDTGPNNSVLDVAFSPDGTKLAAGISDNRIMLWDTDTYTSPGEALVGHDDAVWSVAFSPDSKTLAAGSKDATITLWDVNTGAQLGPPLDDPEDAVLSLAFSPDGQLLASTDESDTIILWDVQTKQPLGKLPDTHTDTIWRAVFSPDGKILAVASADHTISLWDVTTQQQIGSPLTGHTFRVYDVAFSPDGRMLASASGDDTIRLWDVETGQPLNVLAGHSGNAFSVAFNSDGQTLASGGGDQLAILWNIATEQSLGRSILDFAGAVERVAISPNGNKLAVINKENTLQLWDTVSGQLFDQQPSGHPREINSLTFSPDEQMLASSGEDGTVKLWDIGSNKLIEKLVIEYSDVIAEIAFSHKGHLIALGPERGPITLWDISSEQPRKLDYILDGHQRSRILDLNFSPDDKILASAGSDQTILLWDTATGEVLVPPLINHDSPVGDVAFSQNGELLASGSDDKTVGLWDVKTGRLLAKFIGHNQPVTAVAFSPDGKLLASGSEDETIRLWDIAARQPLGSFTHPGGAIDWIVFSPDGDALISVNQHGSVFLWQINPEEWKKQSCRIANRNLTQAEWEEFIGPDTPYQLTCPNLPPG